MRARLVALLSTVMFLSVVLPAQSAYAQSDAEKAAELYKAGIDLYFAEDFGLAITKFRAGFELDPNPMFLYSLSLCFSKLGNFEQALENAERAQKAGGMEPEVTTKNDARLASFRILVHSDEVLGAMIADAGKPDGPAVCATNKDCSEGEVCNIRRGVCVSELPVSDDGGKPLFTPVGWGGVGAAAVGVGLLVGGGVTSLGVKKKQDRLDIVSDPSNAEFDATERDELVGEIEDRKSVGRILVLGGAGLTIVGAALIVVDLFVLNKGTEDEATATFSPMLLPGGAGFTWALRF